MDTRNVQKTGDMLYLYLPTRWCKKFNINGKSKVGLRPLPDGSLGIYPQTVEEKPIHLSFRVKGEDADALHKLIIASYISPASSFEINLEKEFDFMRVLTQKNLVSLELVEVDGSKISCESSMIVKEPLSLLQTMIRKIKNLLLILSKEEYRSLLDRYEEEIDRSKLLIEKAVVGGLINPVQTKHAAIELHYMSQLSKELERIVDQLLVLKTFDKSFLRTLSVVLNELLTMLKNKEKNLDYEEALLFVEKIQKLQNVDVENVENYPIERIVRSLNSIGEVVIDWAVIVEMEKN